MKKQNKFNLLVFYHQPMDVSQVTKKKTVDLFF